MSRALLIALSLMLVVRLPEANASEASPSPQPVQCKQGVHLVWVPTDATPEVYYDKGDPRYSHVPGSVACEDAALSAHAVRDTLISVLAKQPTSTPRATSAPLPPFQYGAQLLNVPNGGALNAVIPRVWDKSGPTGLSAPAIKEFPRQQSDISAPDPARRSSTSKVVQERIYFATDRQRVTQANGDASFTNEFSKTLQYGVADVLVPADHRPAPQSLTDVIVNIFFHVGPQKQITVTSVSTQPANSVLGEIRAVTANSAKHEVLVFIHGFNVPWQGALQTMAGLAYDLNFDGPAVALIWPSEGTGGLSSLPLYSHDRQHVQDAAPALADALTSIAQASGASEVHVITHSMGAYGLGLALTQLAAQHRQMPQHVHDISLAAPDVSVMQFNDQFTPLIKQTTTSLTIYSSSKDVAMTASQLANGVFPLGGQITPVDPSFTLVDASAVDTDFLGHGYFEDQDIMIEDFHENFVSEPLSSRPLLHRSVSGAVTYYSF